MNQTFKSWLEASQPQWDKFVHQRTFPFMHNHENPLNQYAKDFLGNDYRDLDMENAAYAPGKLYHVTTNLSGVRSSGMLKSRAELGGTSFGLGGGPTNMAPTAVSLTYSYDRAVQIYDDFKFVSMVVANRIPASEIHSRVSMARDSDYRDIDEEMDNFETVLINYGVTKEMIVDDDTNGISAALDKNITSPKAKYKFMQQLEAAVTKDEADYDHENGVKFDTVTGFTTPFEKMRSLKPENIAIIQVLLRKDATVEHYSQEAEIRANSKDLVVSRFIKP